MAAPRRVASALLTASVAELFVFNRRSERALELARELVVAHGARPVWGLPLVGGHLADLLPHCSLLVNTTPVGAQSLAPEAPSRCAHPTCGPPPRWMSQPTIAPPSAEDTTT